MTIRVRCQKGASFIEVIAAVGVFAIVAIGLSPALLSARKFTDRSRSQSVATALAQDKIEQFRTLSAAAVSAGTDGPLQANGSNGGIFTRNWAVWANSPISGISRVEVTVSWPERPAGTASVKLVTLVPQ